MLHKSYPFPGMNPSLEHPLLWGGFHLRLVVAIADQLQPLLAPRYLAAVEARRFIELDPHGAQHGLRQCHIEILDAANDMGVTCAIEIVSPSNKQDGAARKSYMRKREKTIEGQRHLVEVDLLRHGLGVWSLSESKIKLLPRFDYLICVNRWRSRQQLEIYACPLRQQLPRIFVPLNDETGVALDLQTAVEKVYEDGRYGWRLRYDRPCEPLLSKDDQQWALEQIMKSGG